MQRHCVILLSPHPLHAREESCLSGFVCFIVRTDGRRGFRALNGGWWFGKWTVSSFPLSHSLTLTLHGKRMMCHGSSGLERGGKGCFISNRPLFVSGPIRACCGLIFLWKCLRWFWTFEATLAKALGIRYMWGALCWNFPLVSGRLPSALRNRLMHVSDNLLSGTARTSCFSFVASISSTRLFVDYSAFCGDECSAKLAGFHSAVAALPFTAHTCYATHSSHLDFGSAL